MWMRSQTRERVVTFGFSEGCDVRALEAELDWPGGMRLRASVFGEEVEVRTRLLGRPSVYPMLAALAVTRLEGLPLGPAVERLAMLEPGKLRLEPALLPCGAWVLRDEFKAAVETYEAALEVAGQIPARRKIMVLGLIEEPMESDTIVYRQIGRWAGVVAERIIFIGGRKQSRLVRQGAVESGLAPEMVFKAGQLVHGALQFIPEDLGPGDLVLLKGRSSQRLDRIWYALSGRTVRCTIEQCNTVATRCAYCNMLERGWEGRRVVI